MPRVGGEVAAEIGGPAVLQSDPAVGPYTLAASTLDADETALADAAAGPAVVEIGVEIDADAVTRRPPVGWADAVATNAGRSGRAGQLTEAAVADIALDIDAGAATAG
jgi:hypothetical protein